MAEQLISTADHDRLPDSYVRPETQRPRLSEVVPDAEIPVVDLASPDRAAVVAGVAEACRTHGFFQVLNHGVPEELTAATMMDVAYEFFRLSAEEKTKLYSDDPAKKMRLSTSFNVRKETVHNWRDYLRLHCHPLERYVPDWPDSPPAFSWSVPDKVMEDHLKDCFSDTFEYNTENIKFSVFSSQERGTVKFSVFSSQEGGTDIKDGSKMILVPKHCSVHHPVVQMVLFAEVTSNSFYCWRPMVPRGITDLIEKSSSDKCIDAVQIVYKAGWADARDGLAPVTYAVAPVTQARTAGGGNQTPALWLDSGAGHHCVGDASVLCNLRDPPAGTAVKLADGFQHPVTKIGDIRTDIFQISDVYLVPGLQMNVISVRQLAKCKIFSTFYENHADLCRDGERVGGAIVDDNASIYRLYYLAAVGNAAASTN